MSKKFTPAKKNPDGEFPVRVVRLRLLRTIFRDSLQGGSLAQAVLLLEGQPARPLTPNVVFINQLHNITAVPGVSPGGGGRLVRVGWAAGRGILEGMQGGVRPAYARLVDVNVVTDIEQLVQELVPDIIASLTTTTCIHGHFLIESVLKEYICTHIPEDN